MTFPVQFEIVALSVHPHLLFEGIAYAVGFRIYLRSRDRRGDFLPRSERWTIVAAAIVGAAVGAKLLHHLGDPRELVRHWRELAYWAGGKTIVGGLLGGWIAVELAKRRCGITRSTGDLFAIPLALGIAIGRVGCFLTGLPDGTHGIETGLPTGVDFGDGVRRHPTQLYEIAFLLLLTGLLVGVRKRGHVEGDLFKLFMAGYLGFRLGIDALKPAPAFAGLSAIQWAAAGGLLYLGWAFARRHEISEVTPHA